MPTHATGSTNATDLQRTPTPDQPLLGQRALVTGGGRGLGAVISARLARAGARVAITGRDEKTLQQ